MHDTNIEFPRPPGRSKELMSKALSSWNPSEKLPPRERLSIILKNHKLDGMTPQANTAYQSSHSIDSVHFFLSTAYTLTIYAVTNCRNSFGSFSCIFYSAMNMSHGKKFSANINGRYRTSNDHGFQNQNFLKRKISGDLTVRDSNAKNKIHRAKRRHYPSGKSQKMRFQIELNTQFHSWKLQTKMDVVNLFDFFNWKCWLKIFKKKLRSTDKKWRRRKCKWTRRIWLCGIKRNNHNFHHWLFC